MDRFTVIEIAQLVVTSIGLVASWASLRDAARLHTWAVANNIGNGRRLVSTGHLVGEALRGGWQALLFCAALISYLGLPSPPEVMDERFLDWLVLRKVVILLGSIFCLALTLWDLYIRRVLGHVRDV